MKLKSLVVGPYAANCYIIGSEAGEGIILDPGAEAQRILKALEELSLNIKFIVATHGHGDHIGAIKKVKEATRAQFAVHRQDEQLLSRSLFSPSPQPEMFLEDGDSLKVTGLSFVVLHTPGHSPGGICLSGHGAVFTGDTLFCQSIGRFDMPGANGRQLLNSIRTKLMTLPDSTVVYPGHGPETTIGDERRWNPFLKPGLTP